MLNPNETICLVSKTAFNGDGFVVRTFKTKQTAWEFENRCNWQVTIHIIPGNWKIGDLIPFGTPMFSLYSYIRDRRNANA